MKIISCVGPLALAIAGILFYWGTIDPEGKGYGLPILFFLLLSVMSGFMALKQAQSSALRITAWACIGIPIALIIYFLVFIISFAIGSLPQEF